ncbi:hypothetical protein Bbelb_232800 [Branchiostoma belcheri]|nr:hypothetical protein Bbelb_232800 [Branchiostoma belcheri]
MEASVLVLKRQSHQHATRTLTVELPRGKIKLLLAPGHKYRPLHTGFPAEIIPYTKPSISQLLMRPAFHDSSLSMQGVTSNSGEGHVSESQLVGDSPCTCTCVCDGTEPVYKARKCSQMAQITHLGSSGSIGVAIKFYTDYTGIQEFEQTKIIP